MASRLIVDEDELLLSESDDTNVANAEGSSASLSPSGAAACCAAWLEVASRLIVGEEGLPPGSDEA